MSAEIKTNFWDKNTSHSLETSICDLLASICMGKSIRKQRVKMGITLDHMAF